MANRTQIQIALQKPYDRILFGKEVLSPVFGSCFSLSSTVVPAAVQPNKTEQSVIESVSIYGNINLEDGTEITCYEISLQPTVRIEQSRVAIQRYVRKLLTAGQIALVNFISPQNKSVWRLTLVAKDSEITEEGIKEKTTHAKRYTYLLGPSETCKTAAERFESLSAERRIIFQTLVNAFSVERLSDAFFDEYTLHYQKFCDYLQESNFRKSVFKISFPANASKEEKDKACKPIRDFVKKLLGRIVFLYFVQKKRWLGATDTNYKDGLTDFIKQLFKQSGGNEAFYSTWLTVLFFETLNKDRTNDDFKMPDGKKVKVPFLNGGLFDKEDYDEHILTFKSKLFHNSDFEDTILTEKNPDNSRGFLDFLNAFNFTVHEDSPDDHIVAVDPEMLGHIFENLLEDNKDKGAFYTPKEIVHYMCHESLTEYLTTHLSKEYTVYKEIGNAQVELFGNETKQGQLKLVEQLGDKALNRDDVAYIVKYKDISKLTKAQLQRISQLLDSVKICDPAIGSGAFPMGLLQEIFAIKEVIAFELGLQWKPAEVKENIIQNSIYGVDIEKGAVDIARLRFWLSLVVDEEKPRSLPNLDYKIVVGDSLLSKFEGEIIEIDWERKSGVGKAKEYIENIQSLLRQIANKQKNFFKPNNKNKKKEQTEIRGLKLELLINQLSFDKQKFLNANSEKGGFAPSASDLKFNEQIKERRKEFDRHISKLQNLSKNKEDQFEHFDWKLDFPEVLNPYIVNDKGGFDILIANPPYIGQSGNRDLFQEVLKSEFGKTFHQRRMDYFYFFFHKAIRLTKEKGIVSFITTNYFINATYADKLRKDLYENCRFVKLINFNEAKIFESATGQHNAISILTKDKLSDAIVETAVTQRKGIIKGELISNILYRNDPSTRHFKIRSSEVFELPKYHILIEGIGMSDNGSIKSKLLNRIKNSGQPLINIADIVQGIVSGANDLSPKYKKEYNLSVAEGSGIFVLQESELNKLKLNKTEKEFIKPWFKNSDINRWNCKENTNQYLIYITSTDDVDESKIPNLINHFKPFKILLINRNVRTGRYSLSDYSDFLKGQIDIPYVMIKSSFKRGKYYLISYARDKYVFEVPKIICPQRSPINTFGYTEKPWYGASDVYYIVAKEEQRVNLKFLLAILNSKLIYFWLYNKGQRKGEILQLFKDPLSEIPVVSTLASNERIISTLSDYIIYLKKHEQEKAYIDNMSLYFERLVDICIYELYFPEIIKSADCEILVHLGNLRSIDKAHEETSEYDTIKETYKIFTSTKHPIDSVLIKINNILEINSIEGKDETNY